MGTNQSFIMEGMSDHHASMIDKILRFTRMKRGGSIKEVSLVFDDVKEDRLNEGNYNDADVEAILDHAKEMVTSSLESELSFIGHTQALLVRQLMTQAEIHEVMLSIEESELENQTLLNAMKAYDELQEKMPEMKAQQKLKSLGGQQIPMIEQINRLQDENKLLKKKLAGAEAANEALTTDMEGANKKAAADMEMSAQACDDAATDIANLEKQVAAMKAHAGSAAEEQPVSEAAVQQSSGEVDAMKDQIADFEKEKQALSKELDKKIKNTTQYKNIMAMLTKKNKANKEMLQELKKLNPEKYADSGSDTEDEDD